MKITSTFHRFALLGSILTSSSLHALEVHEWGTFTILSSAQGSAVNWYQPASDIDQLPRFTYNIQEMKQRIPAARVRMETPVIYFYPEKEMTVHARVAFRNGIITERFPAPSLVSSVLPSDFLSSSASAVTEASSEEFFRQRVEEFAWETRPLITHWKGNLLPPDHQDEKLIPAVTGTVGAHYAAARNVPDAWLFRSSAKVPLVEGKPNQQVEKFIFYRGAGQDVPPYAASMSGENSVTFYNNSQSASTFQVAVRVRDGRACWIKMPNIAVPDGKSKRDATITFPEETKPVAQADQELSAVFLSELTSRGLTKDEAQAMIDTWNHTWFTEPGQRIFTIVDRSWVDSVLPLAISPEPKKTERVFVARYEIISPDTEQKLSQLLKEKPSDQSSRDFASLQLGRFAFGAAEIVSNQMKSKALENFSSLKAIDDAEKSKAAAH